MYVIYFVRHSIKLTTLCERRSSVQSDRYVVDASRCVRCIVLRLRFILVTNGRETPIAHGTDAVPCASTALKSFKSLLLSKSTAMFAMCHIRLQLKHCMPFRPRGLTVVLRTKSYSQRKKKKVRDNALC